MVKNFPLRIIEYQRRRHQVGVGDHPKIPARSLRPRSEAKLDETKVTAVSGCRGKIVEARRACKIETN